MKTNRFHLSFSVSKADAELIDRIAARAVRLARESHIDWDYQTATMDLTATHANGCRLRLDALLESDNFNFIHDVFGIRAHLDRTTGQLMNCFLPRYAAPQMAGETVEASA